MNPLNKSQRAASQAASSSAHGKSEAHTPSPTQAATQQQDGSDVFAKAVPSSSAKQKGSSRAKPSPSMAARKSTRRSEKKRVSSSNPYFKDPFEIFDDIRNSPVKLGVAAALLPLAIPAAIAYVGILSWQLRDVGKR